MVLYIQICQFCLPVNDKYPTDEVECEVLQAALQKACIEAKVNSALFLGVCSTALSLAIQA